MKSLAGKTNTGEAVLFDDLTSKLLRERAAREPLTTARLLASHNFVLIRETGGEWTLSPAWCSAQRRERARKGMA